MPLPLLQTLPAGGGALTAHTHADAGTGGVLDLYGALADAETWVGLATFNAGIKLAAGQAIQDSGGNDRYNPSISSPESVITGDIDISGFLAVGSVAVINPAYMAYMSHEWALGSLGSAYGVLVQATDKGSIDGGTLAFNVYGIGGGAINQRAGTKTINKVAGLIYSATHSPSAASNTTELFGLDILAGVYNGNGTVATIKGVQITITGVAAANAPTTITALDMLLNWSGAAPTNYYGIKMPAIPSGTNRYGLFMSDISAGTIARLLELGPTPYLRLYGSGEWSPAANQTPLDLAEGVTPTRRNVRWKAGDALGAGDKVMVMV